MKKHKPKLLTLAMLPFINPVFAASDGAYQVTGSRLKQQEAVTALPVTIYTREQILQSGESNLADFIRNLPMNSFGSFRPVSGSTAQSTSTINFRGLSSSRSLVLIDGRRLGKSPLIGSSDDLNLIPLGSVERIEVLMDGASAIYGADASAGVVNIITRSHFEGVELMLGGGKASIPSSGGETEEGSVVFGTSSADSSLLAGVSWNDREIVLNRDLPWLMPQFSVFGNNFTTLFDGFDLFDLTAIPGGCDYPDSGFRPSATGRICGYDFDLQAADEASIENKSFYAKASQKLNDNWQLSINSAFRQTESFGQYAPTPGNSVNGNPLSVDSPNNPTNPNSPLYDPNLGYAPQPVNWWHRFDALGNRETTVTNQQLDFGLNLDGKWAGIDWQFGLRHLDSRSRDIGRNLVLRGSAEQLIESGEYDLANPYDNPESVLNALRHTAYRNAKFDQNEYFASARFNPLQLPNGSISTIIGIEHRTEKYTDQYDPQSEAGQVLGSAGNTAGINRDVNSAYVEALVPVLDSLDLRMAARQDDYSIKGDAVNTHISVRYQPLDNLSLYLGYSDNSTPPLMDIISQQPISSTVFVRDPQSCINQGQDPGCSAPIEQISFANPELDKEQAENIFFGATFNLSDWFEARLNWYDITITDRIRSYSSQNLVTIEINGERLPNGLGCLRSPSGDIARCFTGFGNGGKVETSGGDLSLQFNYALFNGQFKHQLQGSFVEHISVDGNRNLVSDEGSPQFRATLNNSYSINDWQFNYNINVIDSQQALNNQYSIPSWVTHDVQINYHTPWQAQLTVGAKNLGENFPPLSPAEFRDYNFNLYNGFGRIVYARYTQTF